MMELEALQEIDSEVRALGARIVTLTPELERYTLDRFHDESEYRLPMPSRYVVDREGIIRAADVNADYTMRPEASETLKVLRALKA